MRRQQEAWSFDSQDLQRFESLLARYLQETRARYVALVDRSGQLLAEAGSSGGIDATSFASLAAADFGASGELARLLGEDDFASLYHQGDGHGMFLVDIGGRAILASLFNEHTTLGLLRLTIRSIVPELVTLLSEAGTRGGGRAVTLEADWLAEAESQIDRLFGA